MGQGTVYDLQSRQRADPRHLRRLRALNEGLARAFGAALSSLLRTPADVSLTGIDQLAYGQFISSVAPPACFYLLKADPLADLLMLDIEPSILQVMIDRLLGGGGNDGSPLGRPLTEIDLCLAARIVRLFLQECCGVWKSALDLKLDIQQMESNPRLLRVLPADETVILVGFELAVGELRGMMRLCMPGRAIAQVGDKLSADNPTSTIPHTDPSPLAEVKVILADTQIAADELADLRVGDIVATETGVDSPAIVSIDGAAEFRAKPGVYQGRKAARLTEAIESPAAKSALDPSLRSG
jgi:flagellar motor switch protein FliM